MTSQKKQNGTYHQTGYVLLGTRATVCLTMELYE